MKIRTGAEHTLNEKMIKRMNLSILDRFFIRCSRIGHLFEFFILEQNVQIL